MHGKKLAAVVLAMVMALALLTGCGSMIGSHGGDLDLAEVNSILSSAGCDVTVDSRESLDVGVRVAAGSVSRGEIKGASAAINKVEPYVSFSYRALKVYTISEASVLAGSSKVSGAEALGALNSPEKLVAASVLYYESLNRGYTSYYACAQRCTDPRGTAYWVIGLTAE